MPGPSSSDAAREICQVLLTVLRCIAMKRALNVTKYDKLNFFRLYDGCLMDATVISWWKVFGNRNDESHWRNHFAGQLTDKVKRQLHSEVGGCTEFEKLWEEVKCYRHRYVAHHEFDTAVRPTYHLQLDPLRHTAEVIYRELFAILESSSSQAGLPEPDNIMGDARIAIEEHWRNIANAARDATESFEDAPVEVLP